ncbi:MAG: succinate dehydrogenase/fumarate reductase transmembrane subunit, partial [Planctomycetota bacterium]
MSVQQQTAAPSADRYYFLVRRLHSLSGLIPVGVFLCIHLTTNASILASSDGSQFQANVDKIHALGPLLLPVEIVGIFVPLLFHTLVGFQIMFTAHPNAQAYRYGGNIRYSLQRATGVIAFFFILYHVWQMHKMG